MLFLWEAEAAAALKRFAGHAVGAGIGGLTAGEEAGAGLLGNLHAFGLDSLPSGVCIGGAIGILGAELGAESIGGLVGGSEADEAFFATFSLDRLGAEPAEIDGSAGNGREAGFPPALKTRALPLGIFAVAVFSTGGLEADTAAALEFHTAETLGTVGTIRIATLETSCEGSVTREGHTDQILLAEHSLSSLRILVTALLTFTGLNRLFAFASFTIANETFFSIANCLFC